MRVASPGPLAGVRIVEVDAIGPVPFAALLLADMGADVVRVRGPGQNASDIVPALYRGRHDITLDFRHPAAVAELLELVTYADGVIEGMAVGSMEALGAGPDHCRARNQRLVYGRASTWGQSGPLAGAPGTDINVLALTGALHAIGSAQMPAVPLNLVGDYAGCAMFLALGMVSAILGAQATGEGRVVDAAEIDGVGALLGLTQGLLASGRWVDQRESNLVDGGAPFYRVYRCADGGHVAVGAIDGGQFERLCSGLGVSGVAQFDRAAWPAMEQAFARAFATRSRTDWMRHFAMHAGCVTPVLSLAEASHHPGVQARRPVAAGPVGAVAPQFVPRTAVAVPARAATVAEILSRWS